MSAVGAVDGRHPLGTEVTRLLQVAMVVFVWTIGIGILNGTDVVDFAAAAAVAILVNIVFINYLVAANEGDVDLVATNQILALDHTMFIGVLTNAILALLLVATVDTPLRWPRVDDVLFVGMNVSLLAFVVGLLAESTWAIRIATPVLGACILVGLLDRGLAPFASTSRPAPLPAAVPAS